jgi:hypothetical protein
MTGHRIHPLELPEHWTPAEALAVFEMIDLLRDQIWDCYGHDIQQALRDQITDRDCLQPDLPLDSETPF